MKTTKFLQTFSLLLILIIAISCRSSRSTTGRDYPRNSTPPTETSTNTYPIVQSNGGNLPPGQAKKIYGGQSAKAYAPGQRKKCPLVIVHTTNIVINRYSDGRYYYRNTAGYTYWKGDDERYYLDEKHLKDIEYEEGEYDDWKFKGQKNNKAREAKGKEEETVKEDQKIKDTEHITKVREQKGMGQNQKVKDNDQKGKDQFDQKVKNNDQKGKNQFDQKVKDNDQKEKDQINQKAKDVNQKEKDQTDQKAKDVNQKEKDQTDQKAKDVNQKEKDQTDQKTKDSNQKGKDQTDQKAKDDSSPKGKAKSKDKA